MGYRPDHEPSSFLPIAYRLLPLACACVALALLFCAAFQMDRPAIEWVRSLQGLWIERIGDAGYVIGSGVSLIAISGLFVAVGYARANPVWRQAGLRGWAAQALTAILVQGLKHGIGRPRPRLHREDEFFTGPGLESGLDAFPSGHASASFAVATVVAKYCPALAWPAYGLAGFVAVTRVFRGSHFVSDVVAGVVLGIVVGTLVATPIQEWKVALRHFLLSGTPWLVVACAVVMGLAVCGMHYTGMKAAIMRHDAALPAAAPGFSPEILAYVIFLITLVILSVSALLVGGRETARIQRLA